MFWNTKKTSYRTLWHFSKVLVWDYINSRVREVTSNTDITRLPTLPGFQGPLALTRLACSSPFKFRPLINTSVNKENIKKENDSWTLTQREPIALVACCKSSKTNTKQQNTTQYKHETRLQQRRSPFYPKWSVYNSLYFRLVHASLSPMVLFCGFWG